MRNFASPSRYIQGENALFENAKAISELGTHPVLLCDSVVYDIVGKRFEEYLVQNGLTVVPVFFNGEASDNEINRVVSLAKEEGCDLLDSVAVRLSIVLKLLQTFYNRQLLLPQLSHLQMLQFQLCLLSILTRVPLSAISSILRTQSWFWWIVK